jgi:uncharacterized protein with von Willebrand factor type A (vWA) domain
LNGNQFDVGNEVVCGAKIQHFLRLGNATDQGTRELPALADEIEHVHRQRLWRRADERERRVTFEQLQISVDPSSGAAANRSLCWHT